MKELKVRFRSQDSGYCREVWEVYSEEGRPRRYVLRNTADPAGRWETACGEFCEPDSPAGNDITFVLCDRNWKEQGRTGNDRTRFPEPFPTLEQACIEEWNHLPKAVTLLRTHEFRCWIATWKPQELPYLEDINWCDNSHKPIRREILHRFDYCGAHLAIICLSQRHTLCRAIWREYFVGEEIRGEYESYIQFFGYECGNYVIQTNPLKIANLPYRVEYEGAELSIVGRDIRKFNSLVGSFSPSLHRSRDPKMKFLVSVLKERATRLNAGLEPSVDKRYYCATCGSRSGKCHPDTGYCFLCDTDNWTPVNYNDL